jgi:hypothetical protein
VVCKWTDSLMMDCSDVFGSFLTARMRVSVPRPYRLDVYVCSKSC